MQDHVVCFILLPLVLIAASVIDFRSRRIPNWLSFPAVFVFITYYSVINGREGLFFSLAGLGAGIGLLILPYAIGAMGAGDVKLMGAVGSALGAKGVLISFLLTALFGGAYAVIVMVMHQNIFKGFYKRLMHTFLAFLLTKKYDPDPLVEHEDKPRLCYGIAIALGTLAYIGLIEAGYNF